jgi:hypothetical protein
MEGWLDRRRLVEAGVQFLSGLFFALIGIVVLAVVSVGVACFIYIGLTGVEAMFAHFGANVNLRRMPIEIALLLLATVLCFIGAHKHRFGMDYSSGEPALERAPADAMRIFLNPIWEVLFAGPGLLITSYEDLHRAWRLMNIDLVQVASVVLWVFEKGGKADVREMSRAFTGINTIRIFPQLRDLPGVIWLLDNRGVLLLSDAIRKELADLLGESPGPTRAKSEPYDTGPRERERPRQYYPEVSEEVQAWYETLNLPPFAPLHQVKRNYRQLVKIHHPDVAARNAARSGLPPDERIKQINLAYQNIIKHSLSRDEPAGRRG